MSTYCKVCGGIQWDDGKYETSSAVKCQCPPPIDFQLHSAKDAYIKSLERVASFYKTHLSHAYSSHEKEAVINLEKEADKDKSKLEKYLIK